MKDPFVRKASEYVRDVSILSNYAENMATYLSVMSGKPVDACKQWVKQNITPQEPELRLLAREEDNPDRFKRKAGLTKYLAEVEHTGRILAPNLIQYANPEKKLGFLPNFIDLGLQRRKAVKKQGQKAEMEGDTETATYCNNQQSTIKILNNSISGAHASPHNPIYNASAHTTLTSICRCATSYSNALVERLLAGNRHYFSPDVTLADLVATVRLTDMGLVRKAMKEYGIVPPTAAYLKQHVQSSALLYWRSPNGWAKIEAFIDRLNDEQRAACAFVMDFKALRDTNDGFMRRFIGGLVEKPVNGIEDAKAYADSANPDLVAMIGLVMSEELAGRTVHRMAEANPEHFKLYGAAIKGVEDHLSKYQLFIDAFLKTDNMPGSIYSVPTVLRKVAIVSDTDSTIFTTEDWVRWYVGKNDFGRLGMSVAGAMAYLDSQVLKHILAMLSRHLGVKDDNLFRLAMKSEFYQPVMGVTNKSKHYFSYILAQEGNVKPKPKFDTKGVNLKNSRLPKHVVEELDDYIRWIMDSIMQGLEVTLYDALRRPVLLANEIRKSLLSGDANYLMSMQIKSAKAYKNADRSNYIHYTLWEASFAKKYGPAGEPPYSGVKIPVNLDSPIKMTNWLKTIDPELAEGIKDWMASTISCECGEVTVQGEHCGDCNTKASGRRHFTNIIIPRTQLRQGKIPEELLKVINVDGIESEMMAGFLIVLETLGIYMQNKSKTRLLSQEVDPAIYGVDAA